MDDIVVNIGELLWEQTTPGSVDERTFAHLVEDSLRRLIQNGGLPGPDAYQPVPMATAVSGNAGRVDAEAQMAEAVAGGIHEALRTK